MAEVVALADRAKPANSADFATGAAEAERLEAEANAIRAYGA